MVEWIISSSLLILIVIALRTVLKRKISLLLRYTLWALVLVRLLVPISFGDSALSIQNLTRQAATISETQAVSEAVQPAPPQTNNQDAYEPAEPTVSKDEQWGTDIEEAPAEEYEQTVAPVTEEKESLDISVSDVLMLVWLIGTGVVGAALLVSNLRFYSKLRRTRTPLPLKHYKRPVYISDEIDTPCLFGLFRPAIYVTHEATKTPATLRHTIEHEMTHFKHRDNIWSLLRGVCLALHWYNPLVWWAAVLSRNDSELACDESTILRLGEWERASYGRTLIGLTCQKRPALLNTATTMTGSGKSIKERISLIAKTPKMATFTLLVVLLIAAVVVGVTFTGAAQVPWYWAQNIKTDDIVSAVPWKDFENAPSLTDDETAELVRLLNELEKEDFTENSELVGMTPTFGLYIETEEVTYRINESDTLEMEYDDKLWWIDSAELREFIEDKAGVEDTDEEVPEDTVVNETQIGIPDLLYDYAMDYASETIMWELLSNEMGEYMSEAELENAVSDISIQAERVNTGTAGISDSVEMYCVDYSISQECLDAILRNVEGNAVAFLEGWTGSDRVYLLLHRDISDGHQRWERCGAVLPDEIEWLYNTQEMTDKYGDPYTAAAMEVYRRYQNENSKLMRIVDSIFGSEGGSYTLTATDSDGSVDVYTCSAPKAFYINDSKGNVLIDYYDLTEVEAPSDAERAVSEFSFLFEKDICSLKVYSDDNIIEVSEGNDTTYILAEYIRAEELNDDGYDYFGYSEMFSFFRQYAEEALSEYELYAASVDGSETNYEVIAQSLAEQYTELVLERPGWHLQPADELLVKETEVFDAYYGEDNPNFCFHMSLALKTPEDELNFWHAGTGLTDPPTSGEFAGYYGWGTQARVAKSSDGNWWRLPQFNTGGSYVDLPYSLETATTEQLVDTYFLTSGYTHDTRVFFYLLEKPIEEVKAELDLLNISQREELTDSILSHIENYPLEGVWTKQDFIAICT